MDALSKLERTILGWLKGAPHLPVGVRTWLGENIWWLVAIATVLCALAVLGWLNILSSSLGAMSSPWASYYVSTAVVGWTIVSAIVGLIFTATALFIMAFAISPLKEKQKRGWTLLFVGWLVAVVATVVSAVLTLNPLSFIGNLIFGAVWMALSGYILFEMHGQFAHVERSKGVKRKKS